MSIPSRSESARLLLSLDPPEWHLRHSRAVAEVAGWLARASAARKRRVSRPLVEAAALLHDVDKLAAVRGQVHGLPHGEGSALWLGRAGYSELGPAVEAHPVTRLADGDWFERWIAAVSPEALIVVYADKRAGQRLEPMADRFASWERRYPPDDAGGQGWSRATLSLVRARAQEIERRVCEMAGVQPREVRRLPWTARAIRKAATG